MAPGRESTYWAVGLRLTDLGGVAVAVLGAVVGVVLFRLLRPVGLGVASSLAVALVALRLGTMAILQPRGVLADVVSFARLTALLAVGFLCLRAVVSVGATATGRRLQHLANDIEHPRAGREDLPRNVIGPLGRRIRWQWRVLQDRSEVRLPKSP